MLDHRPHDREGRQRARVERPRGGLRAVGIARRQRPARPVHGVLPAVGSFQVARRGELPEEPAHGNFRPRREAARPDELRGGRSAREIAFEAELMDEPEHGIVRELVEVLGAQDELAREERADRRIGDPFEQRLDVFRAFDHAGDLTTRARAAAGCGD